MSTETFPSNWRIGADFDPNEHLIDLKGKSYLGVQHRLLWFIRDQRALIIAGRATMPYILRTELVEHDHERGFAQFRIYVRDVFGNEATMYGSETAKDFGDYVEKASTKSLGRALVLLGYGTASAPEMDEGERVVDTPVERRQVVQSAPAPAAEKWNFLADIAFRRRANKLGADTIAKVNRLVDAACGGPEAPVDRVKVQEYVRTLEAQQAKTGAKA